MYFVVLLRLCCCCEIKVYGFQDLGECVCACLFRFGCCRVCDFVSLFFSKVCCCAHVGVCERIFLMKNLKTGSQFFGSFFFFYPKENLTLQ